MSTGVFPYRKTIATFDDYNPSCVQPRFMYTRSFDMMAQSLSAVKDNVVLDEGIGWRLRSYMDSYKDVQELTDADEGILRTSDGSLVAAPGITQFNSFAKQPLLGASYTGGVQDVGSPMLEKRVAAGASFDQQLTADAASFPPGLTDDDTVPLDRVLVSRDNHEPWDGILFVFDFPSASTGSTAPAKGYFCGPAGSDPASASDAGLLGLGQYCLKAYQSGVAVLAEKRQNGTWIERDSWLWAPSAVQIANGVAYFHIRSNCRQMPNGSFQGSVLTIRSSAFPQADLSTYSGPSIALGMALISMSHPTTHVYRAPRRTQQPTSLQKLRVDLHRLMRVKVQIAKHKYYAPGRLVDDVISFGCPLQSPAGLPTYLYIYMKRIKPDGTELTLEVQDEHGAYLTQVGLPIETPTTTIYKFTPTAKQRFAKVSIDFYTDETAFKTPILESYTLFRDSVFSTENPLTPLEIPIWHSPPALPQAVISSVAIEPQDVSQEAEAATIVVEDMSDALLSILDERTMVPIRIETRTSATDATKKAWLFTGYVVNPEHTTTRHNPLAVSPYPSRGGRKTYTLNCVGEWAASSEQYTTKRAPWISDVTSGNFKITDIIRIMYGNLFPAAMVDVPDLPITLFGQNPEDWVTDPGTRIMDFTSTLAEEYLGAYATFDGAAGTRGMQRLLMPKYPPYNNLAVFQEDGPGIGKLPHFVPSYGTTTSANMQVVQYCYVKATPKPQKRIEKAEGNFVLVQGAGVGQNAALRDSRTASLITQFAVKVDSYNFLGLAPGTSGYPSGLSAEFRNRQVPIQVIDFKLGTQDAVDWRTRRIYDRACWARVFISFVAPLLTVTDVTDPVQTRERRLRYYDPVMYKTHDGTLRQCLVLKCRPTIVKDHIQMAEYTLVTTGNINDIAVMPPASSPFMSLMKGMSRYLGNGQFDSTVFANQKASMSVASQIMGLPELTADPLQYLDNTDLATFGKFKWMMDYDRLG